MILTQEQIKSLAYRLSDIDLENSFGYFGEQDSFRDALYDDYYEIISHWVSEQGAAIEEQARPQ